MTRKYQAAAILILAAFYIIYFAKMAVQKKQGIVTNQIGKDKSDRKRLAVERILSVSSISIILAELISIAFGYSLFRYSWKTTGIVLGVLGDLIFLLAVVHMGNSWRAGVAADDHRKLVNSGIFQLSRNPAFVGFDLVYIGILLMFFNWFLLIFTVFAIVMLHLQILQEEKYLDGEFGAAYLIYKQNVCRYFGRKNWKFWVGVIVAVILLGGLALVSLHQRI